ncbi:MAG: hypothetical protein MSC31_09165 [Solirubrobacteraceae bacterium MAG38_C4-C5]|nr:hypothetical protein [Candidatus Siliceabacter maunaloa]
MTFTRLHPAARPHLSRKVVLPLLALLSAFLFSALIQVALAGHYHQADCRGISGYAYHGFVHGGSTTDNYMHSRMNNTCGRTDKYCEAGSAGSAYFGYDLTNDSTCDFFTGTYPYRECTGYAYVYYNNRISAHTHFAHNSCVA